MIAIKEITPELVRPFRHKILRPNQTLADCTYPGDADPDSYHLGAFRNDQLISIASVFIQHEERFNAFTQTDQYRLRGMGTVEEFRCRGYGKAVLEACLQQCWDKGGEIFWCNAAQQPRATTLKWVSPRCPIDSTFRAPVRIV